MHNNLQIIVFMLFCASGLLLSETLKLMELTNEFILVNLKNKY